MPDVQPRHWRGFAFLGLALSSCGESDHPTRNDHASGANRVAATKLSLASGAAASCRTRASTSRALQLNSASLKRIQRYAGFFERSANDSGRVSDVLSHEVAGPLRVVVLKRGKDFRVLLD